MSFTTTPLPILIQEDLDVFPPFEPIPLGDPSSYVKINPGVSLSVHEAIGKLIAIQMPGVKCKTCLEKGLEVWVIPGKLCPSGHPC